MTAEVDQNKLRVAVLSDLHGNIQAFNAVLEEVAREEPDKIVVCGDVAAGPFPFETIERLIELDNQAYFIRGNADRELILAYKRQLRPDTQEEGSTHNIISWVAQLINQRQCDFLMGFKDRIVLNVVGLGRVLFCHGSPRSDTEIITSLTPGENLEKMFAGLEETIVVCGHTHHQFDRQIPPYRVINPGSVGMPYQGKVGAYWCLLGPSVELRRTKYNFESAVDKALSAGYPDPTYKETILTPPDPDEVAAYFEKVAVERGERS